MKILCFFCFRPRSASELGSNRDSPQLFVPQSNISSKSTESINDQPHLTILTSLPGDLSRIVLPLDECHSISDIVEKCLNFLNVPEQLSQHFALFYLHTTESKLYCKFDRELSVNKIEQISASNQLWLRKAIFSKKLEQQLCDRHPTFSNYVFHQSKSDLKSGLIPVESDELRQRLTENFKLKNISDTICTLHEVPAYNCVTFPPCQSSVQKENPLKMSVDSSAVYLRVCDQNGVNLDFDCVTCSWDSITSWTVVDDGCFSFDFKRPNGKSKTVKLNSDLAQQMKVYFDQVSSERSS